MTIAIGPVPTPNVPNGVSYTPQQTSGSIINQQDQPDPWNVNWNNFWNVGYNAAANSTGGTSPIYSGGNVPGGQEGFYAGMQEYYRRNPVASTQGDVLGNQTNSNPQPSAPSGGSYNFNIGDFENYRSWDPNAAYQDWIAKGRPSPGGSGGGGFDPNQAAINAARGAFNNAYNPLFQQLDSMAGLIPGLQNQREGSVNNLYGAQMGEIQGAKESAMAGLDVSKQQVAQRQAKSVRDLQENLRNMLQAGNIQLGVGGAGDSSAKDMYAFALSKAAGRSSADISNQAQGMYTEIDMQANQIKATYDDNMAKLGTWKAEKLGEVNNWAQELLLNIESQKATARGQQAAALAANETNIINNALSRLQQIDDQVSQWKQGIDSWALERMAQIDDAKAKISGYGKYDGQDIVAKEIQGLGNFQSVQNNELLGYNPWAKQKEEAKGFLSNYRG